MLISYVIHNNETHAREMIERFLEFKNFHKKTGSEIEVIEKVPDDKEINIGDCRGQGYDNGANMSGRIKGVQAQILETV